MEASASLPAQPKRRKIGKDMPNKEAKDDAPPVNKWAHLPPKVCDTCGQSTHDIDRDCCADNQFFLIWYKHHKGQHSNELHRAENKVSVGTQSLSLDVFE